MDDFVYEDINVNGPRRNLSLGIYMSGRVHAESRIEVYESDAFGRCLYLDGALQCSEKDEHIYHETLVHTALLRVKPRKVLIIGGGDGGTLREVLKHKSRGLEKVVFVEINPNVVEVCKKHFPSTELEKNLADPIVELIIQDGSEYVKNSMEHLSFDAILVDCPDPTAESACLYKREFLQDCHKLLVRHGVFAIQTGNVFIKELLVRDIRYELRRLWRNYQYHYVPIPSFPSGGIGFAFATNDPWSDPCEVMPELDTKYLTKASIVAARGIRPRSFNENKRWAAFDWLCQTHFDFRSHCSSSDAQLLNAFFALEDEPHDWQFPHCTISVSQLGDKKNYTFTVLTLENTERLKIPLEIWASMRGIQLRNIPVNGVSWHSNGTVSVHYVGDEEHFKGNEIAFEGQRQENTLSDYMLTDGAECSHYTFSDLSADYYVHERGEFDTSQKRVRTNGPLVRSKLDPKAKELVDNFAKRNIKFHGHNYLSPTAYVLTFRVD